MKDEREPPPAVDGEPIPFRAGAEDWLASWHPPSAVPIGVAHGSAGVCLTVDGEVVLVSEDGRSWDLPGGRPEGEENWRETLDREVLEEACARVPSATLLVFSRGECRSGERSGLVLVRSLWAAEVEVDAWRPAFETRHRELPAAANALDWIDVSRAPAALFRRAFREAGLL
ncbi:MAG: NUDIX domain-containing protein [Chloroflexi bacterium]|nr:NUDIX domain-containing protein [Chloroflexota bacterium]MDA1145689.1 NUDIX domain-containing protein [Chloroflexota bacterium]